jgi:hypothetical protein
MTEPLNRGETPKIVCVAYKCTAVRNYASLFEAVIVARRRRLRLIFGGFRLLLRLRVPHCLREHLA